MREAKAVLEAEKQGLIDAGSASRPNLGNGEPNRDFKVTLNGDQRYLDVKTPLSNIARPLAQQAKDIAKKSRLYDVSTKILIDLRGIDPAQRENFVQRLIQSGLDKSKVIGYLGI